MTSTSLGCPGHPAEHFDIPFAYTVDKLHELAPLFWKDASSSNCTILVRTTADVNVEGQDVTTCTPPPTPPNDHSSLPVRPESAADKNASSRPTPPRRASQVTVLSYKLHRDYLAPQSHLFRRFLSSPLTPPPTSSNLRPAHLSKARAQVVPSLTTPTHTTLLLTLPDQESFPYILHYLYWGSKDVVLGALREGQIGWKGLVNNVEFLGLDDRLKAVCGRYWKDHIRSSEQDSPPALPSSPSTSQSSPSSLTT